MSFRSLASMSGGYQQGQQQKQKTEQEIKAEIFKTMIKEKIKSQMQQEKFKALMAEFQKGGYGFGGNEVNMGSSGQITIKPGEEGLREQPSPQTYMKNPLEMLSGSPDISKMFGYRTPQQQQAQKFQQQAGIFQKAQGIPPPTMPRGASQNPALRPNPAQLRQALLARGQRKRLAPQFGQGRPISQTSTGQYSVGAPRKQSYLEKLPPLTNEQIVTKKGILGTSFGRQTAPRWTKNEWKVIQNIITKEDLAELRRDWQKYQQADVSAQKIIDWFMVPTNVAGTRGKLGTL